MQVRHFGFLHASCAISAPTLRHMISQRGPPPFKPTQVVPPQARLARCPTCDAPMRLVMRLWTSSLAFGDTSCEGQL
jgi:hypothetical protein